MNTPNLVPSSSSPEIWKTQGFISANIAPESIPYVIAKITIMVASLEASPVNGAIVVGSQSTKQLSPAQNPDAMNKLNLPYTSDIMEGMTAPSADVPFITERTKEVVVLRFNVFV